MSLHLLRGCFCRTLQYRTIRGLLKKHDFEKDDVNWVDILPTITTQNNNRRQSSIKLTAIQAPLKQNERFVYRNLLENRRRIKPKVMVLSSMNSLRNWLDKIFISENL